MASALTGCSPSLDPKQSAEPPPAVYVGGGSGSQYGNYAAERDGEMRGPDGEHCVVFNWDRPLGRGLVLRMRSASCMSREFPGRMVARQLSSAVIPVSESNLKNRAE